MAKSQRNNKGKYNSGSCGSDKSRETMSKEDFKKSRNRGNRPFRGDKSGGGLTTPKDSKSGKMSSLNDLSWYSRNPSLLLSTAAIPYPYRPGMSLESGIARIRDYNIPGILAIQWVPSIGTSGTATDPASLVGRQVYARVRSVFSGSLDADPPDFVVYLTCLDSVYSFIAYLKRLYRTVRSVSPNNYHLPNTLLRTLGISNPAAFLSESMNLYGRINELILLAKRFRCPAEFDIFHRHYWMNDNVYMDSPDISGQMYVFKQIKWYRYAAKNTPAGVPAAGAELVAPGTFDVSGLFNFGKSLIDALSAWDDAYTINGYLERAYGDSPNFDVSELGLDELLEPVYVEEVLSQIENAFHLVGQNGIEHTDISQDPTTNSVLYDPQITINDTVGTSGITYPDCIFAYDRYISLRSLNPTVAETVLASRLINSYEYIGAAGSGQSLYHVICGTEIIDSMWIYVYDWSSGTISYHRVLQSTSASGMASSIGLLAPFDWHPQVWMYSGWDAQGDCDYEPIFDIHNITHVSMPTIRDIHRVCILSEWNAFEA